MLTECWKWFSFEIKTKLRWTSGTPNMKKSSAYPVLFGRAVRFAHELALKYGKHSADPEEVKHFVKELIQSLPPEGEELPHVTLT